MNLVKQSGVIPYRIEQGRIEVLLITSSKGKRWIIPKGWIKPFKSVARSAAEEALEEAGILGAVQTPAIGTYEHRKWGLPCRVEVFLMRVETELEYWLEGDRRQRQWVSLDKAVKRIEQPELKQILKSLENRIMVNV